MASPAVTPAADPAHKLTPLNLLLLMSIQELATRISVTTDAVYKWAREGKIKTIKVAGRRLVPIEEVNRIVREGF